jgi:integrase
MKGPRVPCACGCGTFVERTASAISQDGLNFISRAHLGTYHSNHTIAQCGPFVGVLEEYLNGFAKVHYRNPKKHKPRLLPFFQFLAETGYTDLESVSPQTVSEYLAWGRSTGRKVVAYSSGTLSTFFNWMLAEGRRKAANPVIGFLHQAPARKREPRPLETEELDLLWKLLNERGDARTRFAASVAEEAGLRIGEIANLRTSDVDAVRQRLFVRLPNKTNKERWAYFSERTKRYFVEWMAERNPECDHDHVLQNELGDPMTEGTLRELFKRTVCKVYNGEVRHEIGFDKWSTHRLRHTMASNLTSGGADASTVMAMGGWDSPQAMANYARVDADLARRGYDEAMRRAKEQKLSAPRRRNLSPAELLQRKGLKPLKTPKSSERERCV